MQNRTLYACKHNILFTNRYFALFPRKSGRYFIGGKNDAISSAVFCANNALPATIILSVVHISIVQNGHGFPWWTAAAPSDYRWDVMLYKRLSRRSRPLHYKGGFSFSFSSETQGDINDRGNGRTIGALSLCRGTVVIILSYARRVTISWTRRNVGVVYSCETDPRTYARTCHRASRDFGMQDRAVTASTRS